MHFFLLHWFTWFRFFSFFIKHTRRHIFGSVTSLWTTMSVALSVCWSVPLSVLSVVSFYFSVNIFFRYDAIYTYTERWSSLFQCWSYTLSDKWLTSRQKDRLTNTKGWFNRKIIFIITYRNRIRMILCISIEFNK